MLTRHYTQLLQYYWLYSLCCPSHPGTTELEIHWVSKVLIVQGGKKEHDFYDLGAGVMSFLKQYTMFKVTYSLCYSYFTKSFVSVE